MVENDWLSASPFSGKWQAVQFGLGLLIRAIGGKNPCSKCPLADRFCLDCPVNKGAVTRDQAKPWLRLLLDFAPLEPLCANEDCRAKAEGLRLLRWFSRTMGNRLDTLCAQLDTALHETGLEGNESSQWRPSDYIQFTANLKSVRKKLQDRGSDSIFAFFRDRNDPPLVRRCREAVARWERLPEEILMSVGMVHGALEREEITPDTCWRVLYNVREEVNSIRREVQGIDADASDAHVSIKAIN